MKRLYSKKYYLPLIIISLIILTFISCGKRIQLESYLKTNNVWSMYGQNSERKFFVKDTLELPLKIKSKVELKAGLNNSSVTVMDDFIFVGDLKGNVYRIEMSTGRVKNYNSFKQPILTSVILKENELIVPLAELRGKHSVLIVYNLIRGEETSRVIVDGSIENEILYSKDFLVVTTTNGVVYKLNPDYTFDWKLNLDSQIISQPAANNNFIVTATVDGTIYIISFKGSVIKKIKNKHALMSGFTINDGRIYFGDEGGYIHCYDVDKGELLFSKQLDAPIRAIPSVDDKLIFIGDVLGNIFALDKLTGEILWKKNYGGLIRNSILILGDKLVVPNYQKKILILDKNTGRILQELEFDGRIKFSPVYVNKNLIIGYDDKKIALLSN